MANKTCIPVGVPLAIFYIITSQNANYCPSKCNIVSNSISCIQKIYRIMSKPRIFTARMHALRFIREYKVNGTDYITPSLRGFSNKLIFIFSRELDRLGLPTKSHIC